MKIVESAAKKRLAKDTPLVQRDLTTPPPEFPFFWDRNNEVVITLTGEKITKTTRSSRAAGSTWDYTTTLTVPDLLRCLEKAATVYDDRTREWVNRWGAAEKAVALGAIACLRELLKPLKLTPQPRATKPVRG